MRVTPQLKNQSDVILTKVTDDRLRLIVIRQYDNIDAVESTDVVWLQVGREGDHRLLRRHVDGYYMEGVMVGVLDRYLTQQELINALETIIKNHPNWSSGVFVPLLIHSIDFDELNER